jgi:hypothetical protein
MTQIGVDKTALILLNFAQKSHIFKILKLFSLKYTKMLISSASVSEKSWYPTIGLFTSCVYPLY